MSDDKPKKEQKPKKIITCGKCNRAVWDTDVDKHGMCCFCEKQDEPEVIIPAPKKKKTKVD